MKTIGLFLVSSIVSALDPAGCGVGANQANGPSDGGSASSSSSGSGSGSGSGSASSGDQMTCGALGSHLFCNDFDTSGATLPGPFDTTTTSAGTVTLDSVRALSGSQSLLASTLRLTTSTRSFARIEKSFASTKADRFTLSFAEWLDPSCIGSGDGVDSSAIVLRSNLWSVAVRHGERSDSLLEYSGVGGIYIQAHQLKTQLPRGQWVRVSIEVNTESNMMALSIDGTKVVENEPLKHPPGTSLSPKITIGTLTDNLLGGGPSACKLNIDDVTFDAD